MQIPAKDCFAAGGNIRGEGEGAEFLRLFTLTHQLSGSPFAQMNTDLLSSRTAPWIAASSHQRHSLQQRWVPTSHSTPPLLWSWLRSLTTLPVPRHRANQDRYFSKLSTKRNQLLDIDLVGISVRTGLWDSVLPNSLAFSRNATRCCGTVHAPPKWM